MDRKGVATRMLSKRDLSYGCHIRGVKMYYALWEDVPTIAREASKMPSPAGA